MIPRVALIGAGYFAQFHLQAWQRLAQEGQCDLVAVCDSDIKKSLQAASRSDALPYIDAAQLIHEQTLDLVDIATPPASHAALLALTLARNLPTICQKPVAPNFAEAKLVADQVRASSTPVWVHENFRWMPWYREMKAAIDQVELGTLHDLAFRLRPGDGQGQDAYLSRQPYFQAMPRFLVHETLIHLIDTFRFLMGEVVAVSAQLRRVNPVLAGEDAGYVLFRFASGATGLIDANRLNDHSAKNPRLTMGEAWLAGSRGVMRLDGDGGLFWKPHQATERTWPYDWRNQGFGGDCVYFQQRHVLNALAHREAPINLLPDYMRNVEIEEAIYDANAQRREIVL
jgi:D-apiose dehydrogenase